MSRKITIKHTTALMCRDEQVFSFLVSNKSFVNDLLVFQKKTENKLEIVQDLSRIDKSKADFDHLNNIYIQLSFLIKDLESFYLTRQIDIHDELPF